MKPTHIRFLKDFFCNSEGEKAKIQHETDKEIYYNDGCGRYCWVEKSAVGIDFEYVKRRKTNKVKEK